MEEEKYLKFEHKYSMFNGKNFSNWKFRIEILMKEHGVQSFLTKSIDEYPDIIIAQNDSAAVQAEKEKKKEELMGKENKCNSMLIRRISDDYLENVKDKETPKEVWSSLIATFERKGVANRMFLRRKLLTLKMIEGANLEGHLSTFDKILRELKSAGAKMEDEDVICQLLLTLPESYDSVVTALETMKIDELTLEFVKGRLLDSDTKRKTNNESDIYSETIRTSVAMNSEVQKDITCYSCGKKGHYKSQCKQRNYRHANLALGNDDANDHIAF